MSADTARPLAFILVNWRALNREVIGPLWLCVKNRLYRGERSQEDQLIGYNNDSGKH